MIDMTDTITPKSDQINADDLIAGPRTVVVTGVKKTRERTGGDQPVAISFEGDGGKPYYPSLGMRRVLTELWGRDASQYVGRSMTLFRDPDVMFGRERVGGIRIGAMSHLERDQAKTVPVTVSKGVRKSFTVQPIKGARTVEPQEKPPQDEPPALPPELRERALLAAQQGTTTFREFWGAADVKPHRPALQSVLADCQRIAKEADERGAPDDPAPFDVGHEREPGED